MIEEEIFGDDDLIAVGEKIVECAQRVRKMDPLSPGVSAKWTFDIGYMRFECLVKVAPES